MPHRSASITATQRTTVNLDSQPLTLRVPTSNDAGALVDAIVSSVDHLRPWLPWACLDYSIHDAQLWIDGELGDAHRFVMVDRDGHIVGGCGLNALDEPNRRANLGYWLRADRLGRGYASRATVELARFGLEDAGLQRVEIIMSVHNTASRRVAERSGATYEGRARNRLLLHGVAHDAYVYSLIAADIGENKRDPN